MKLKINKSVFEIKQGDITKEKCEAIVNAANPHLAPGGGVSGAIHRAAGPELWEEAKKLGGCRTGEAKITRGYNLARYVIHTVGPVYKGKKEDEELLRKCYVNSLELAKKYGIKSIAFPAISTGVYGYPMEDAAKVSIDAIMKWLRENDVEMYVKLVLYSKRAYEIHRKVLQEFV